MDVGHGKVDQLGAERRNRPLTSARSSGAARSTASAAGRSIAFTGRLRAVSISNEMSAAGTECVSAPTDTKSAPVVGQLRQSARASRRRRSLSCARPCDATHRLPDLRRWTGCPAARCRRRPRPLPPPARGSAPRPRSARPGDRRRAASTAFVTPPARRTWLSLISTQVVEAEAVVRAAAHAHGVLLQRAQRRRRLARVEDR